MPTTTLRRVRVAGFRSIKELDLRLGRTTVLIGPNGAGKSNLLSFFRMLAMIETRSLGLFVGKSGHASSNLHYGPKVTPAIEFRIEAGHDDGSASAYAGRLEHAASDALIFAHETVAVRARDADDAGWVVSEFGAGHAESRLATAARSEDSAAAKAVQHWLARMSYFHFHDSTPESPLRQASRRVEDRYLRSDGRNLAAYLYHLSTSTHAVEQAAFVRIGRLVQQVAPYLKRLDPTLIDPLEPLVSDVRLDWIDRRDERFGAHQLSDGTLRMIALTTALSQPPGTLPTFVVIDEPELGLHPAAIVLFAGLVRSVAPHCQVIVATQSTMLLDQFSPDQVVVVEAHDGESRFVPQDPARLAGWLEDDYALSDLFARNVLGGRP
jgi:predicted ATPase